MKRASFISKAGLGTAMLATGLALCLVAGIQQSHAEKAATPAKVQAGKFQLSGPYTHENITIYLVHGEDRLKGKVPLTLDEALEKRLVVVHETENVNELSIENTSSEDLFLQSGDIVKGGKQDRVVQHDMILSPKSGKVPLASFCVEQGRWQQRGAESVGCFNSSKEQTCSKDLKLATRQPTSSTMVIWNGAEPTRAVVGDGPGRSGAPQQSAPPANQSSAPPQQPTEARPQVASGPAPQVQPNGANRPSGQGEVWKSVNQTQCKLSANVGCSVNAAASASSLQLTLEHEKLREVVDGNVKKLSPIIEGKSDVIGFVFAINGKVNSADIYASNAFFSKVWPKLVKATAVEALAEKQKDKKFEPVGIEAFKTFLADADKAKATGTDITARTQTVIRQTEKTLHLETRDKEKKDAPGGGGGMMRMNILAH